MLYDFYGELLTEKQQEVIELYYNEDLSLAEIAQHSGITRQGVRDSIKRAENQLLVLEEQLGLSKRFSDINKILDSILENTQEINRLNDRIFLSKDISMRVENIKQLVGSIAQQ